MSSPHDPTASVEPRTRTESSATPTLPSDLAGGPPTITPSHPATSAWSDDDGDRPTVPPGYRLVQVLGEGGMGYVFQVFDEQLQTHFALKMAKPGALSTTGRERFRQEAKAMVDLEHPHIARIYTYGEHRDVPYLTMRYLRGGSLANRSKALGRDPIVVLTLMEKVVAATAYLHERGFVHRDLKPHNILLDEAGEPYVSDFGLVKTLLPDSASDHPVPDTDQHASPDPPSSDSKTPHLTATGAILGTRVYMSPEQARGQVAAIGPKSDVWALGVILYELLLGERPFQHHNPDTLTELITTVDPVPPSELDPDFHHGLERIILKCLAKNPADRPTARELQQELHDFLAGEPRRVWWLLAPVLVFAFTGLVWAMFQKPMPTPEPTLAEIRQQLRDRIATGERVQLVDEQGNMLIPAAYLFDVATTPPFASGDPCSLAHDTLNYVELLDDVGVPSYELYGEAKPIRGIARPTAGMYVARTDITSANAEGHEYTSHFFAELRYIDPLPAPPVPKGDDALFKEAVAARKSLAGRHDATLFRATLPKATGRAESARHRRDTSNPELPPNDLPPDGWRALHIRVEPDAYRFTFDHRPMQPIPRPLTQDHTEPLFRQLAHPVAREAVYIQPGGVGLLVDRGTVLYRNVWLQRVPLP